MTNLEYVQSCSEAELIHFLCREIGQTCASCAAAEYCAEGHCGFIDWLKLDRRVFTGQCLRNVTGRAFIVQQQFGTTDNKTYIQSCSKEELAVILCKEMKQFCGMCAAKKECTGDISNGFLVWLDKNK